MKRFLCLYIPRWPLQRLCSVKPELRGKATALYERSAHGPRLVACSVEANKRGVKRGMLLADATALAPDLQLHDVDYVADREALETLALWASRFSPLVGLETSPPTPLPRGEGRQASPPAPLSAGERGTAQPQSLLLDITGCEQVFHGEQNLQQQALAGLARKGVKARAAIAPTIGAAWALAHYGATEDLTTKNTKGEEGLGSRVQGLDNSNSEPPHSLRSCRPSPARGEGTGRDARTTDEARNDDPLCRSSDDERHLPLSKGEKTEALAALPLPALRLDADTVAWLNKLGINCIGDVLNQPRATLPSRFGPQLLERLDQALGSAPELMPLLRPAPEFHATVAFEYLLKDLQWLQPVIEKLVAQVSAEMQQHCRGAREIECWLYQEMGEPLCAAVSLHKASASAQHLLQLLNTQLEGMQSRIQNSKCKMQNDERPAPVAQRKSQNENLHPEDGICAVALRVMATEPLDDEQLALFHQAVKTPESLALTLDRLSTRLGREAVVRARLVDDPQPEDAVAWVGVGEGEAEGGRQTAESRRRKAEGRGQTTENGDAERPLLMLAQPEPIAVMWPRHSLWPLRFEWRGKPQLVREASGPERIETGWWKAAYTRRDYYVVETKAGGRYWIFKRLDDEQWFVQGVFG